MPSCETDAIWDREGGRREERKGAPGYLIFLPRPSVRLSLRGSQWRLFSSSPFESKRIGLSGGWRAGWITVKSSGVVIFIGILFLALAGNGEEGRENSGGVEGALPGAQRPAGRVTPKRREPRLPIGWIDWEEGHETDWTKSNGLFIDIETNPAAEGGGEGEAR